MKTKLIILDGSAELQVIAENDFERKALQLADKYPTRSAAIQLDIRYHGEEPRAAVLFVYLAPEPAPAVNIPGTEPL
jgi:hypothetical protein